MDAGDDPGRSPHIGPQQACCRACVKTEPHKCRLALCVCLGEQCLDAGRKIASIEGRQMDPRRHAGVDLRNVAQRHFRHENDRGKIDKCAELGILRHKLSLIHAAR